jgi:hypothetical protein
VQTTYKPSSSRADNLRAAPLVEVEGVFDNFDKIENGEKNRNDNSEKNENDDGEKNENNDGDGNGATLASLFSAPFGFLVCLASFVFVLALALLALYFSVRRADV